MADFFRPFLALGAIALAGCVSQPQYYWGNYEPVLYAHLARPDKLTPEEQFALLTEDLAKAEEKGANIPPGLLAQRGLVSVKLGQPEAARADFLREKALFPESAVFIDRLIANLPQ